MSNVLRTIPQPDDRFVLSMPVAKETYRNIPVTALEFNQDILHMFMGEVEHSQTLKVRVDEEYRVMVGGEFLLVAIRSVRGTGYYEVRA